MKSTVEILREARDFLSDPDHWLRDGNYAVDADGYAIGEDYTHAAKCCAIGALMRAEDICGIAEPGAGEWLYSELAEMVPDANGVLNWNDRRATHAELLALYDRAIAKASA